MKGIAATNFNTIKKNVTHISICTCMSEIFSKGNYFRQFKQFSYLPFLRNSFSIVFTLFYPLHVDCPVSYLSVQLNFENCKLLFFCIYCSCSQGASRLLAVVYDINWHVLSYRDFGFLGFWYVCLVGAYRETSRSDIAKVHFRCEATTNVLRYWWYIHREPTKSKWHTSRIACQAIVFTGMDNISNHGL